MASGAGRRRARGGPCGLSTWRCWRVDPSDSDDHRWDGQTALHVCASKGWPNGARALLHAKANPHARDASGRDPTHHAASNANHRVLRVLLANGANPTYAPRSARTALHAAALADAAKCVVLLWEAQAELTAVDEGGKTAAMLSASEGNDLRTLALLCGLSFTQVHWNSRCKDATTMREFKEQREIFKALKSRGPERSKDRKNLSAYVHTLHIERNLQKSFNVQDDYVETHGTPADGIMTDAYELYMFGFRLRRTRFEAEERRRKREKRLQKRLSAAGLARHNREMQQQASAQGPGSVGDRSSAPTSRVEIRGPGGLLRRLSFVRSPRSPRAATDHRSESPSSDSSPTPASPNNGGRSSPTGALARALLSDVDFEEDDLSESPSEIAARYAAGPDLMYEWRTDASSVRKQRVARWRESCVGIEFDQLPLDYGGVEGGELHSGGSPSSSSPSGVEPIVLEPSTSADEPLLLSTRLPTTEELELLLYSVERAKVDDHLVIKQIAPEYVHILPGGGITVAAVEPREGGRYGWRRRRWRRE